MSAKLDIAGAFASSRMGKEMSVCEGDTIRFDIQFTAGEKSNLEFFHDGKRVRENDEDGVKITFANDVASLTIQGRTAYFTHKRLRVKVLQIPLYPGEHYIKLVPTCRHKFLVQGRYKFFKKTYLPRTRILYLQVGTNFM